MKAKKLVAFVLAGAMAVSTAALLAACNDKDKEKDNNKDNNTNTTYVEDTTVYYACGEGHEGALLESNWGETKDLEALKFKRDTSVTDANVFKLTLKMYAGDQFKIIHDQSYNGEMGIAYMQGVVEVEDNLVELMDDSNAKATAVKNDSGDIIFYESGGYGQNIALAKGQDATYTFYLHTFPESDTKAYITYEQGETHDRWLVPYNMYVYGDVNDYGNNKKTPDYKMNSSEGNWTYVLNVTSAMLKRSATGAAGEEYAAFQIKNTGDGENEGDAMEYTAAAEGKVLKVTDPLETTDAGEINLIPEGKWLITFNQTNKTVTISELQYEMYFVSHVTNWGDGYHDAKWLLNESQDGSYWDGTFTFTEEDLESYAEGEHCVYFKLINHKTNTWLSNDGNNNMKLGVGTYYIKYTCDGDKIEFEKFEYYLAGTIAGGWGVAIGTSTKLNDNNDGTYSVDFEFVDASGDNSWLNPNKSAFKIIGYTELGGAVNQIWYGNPTNNDNCMVAEVGTYTVTIDFNNLATLTEGDNAGTEVPNITWVKK